MKGSYRSRILPVDEFNLAAGPRLALFRLFLLLVRGFRVALRRGTSSSS